MQTLNHRIEASVDDCHTSVTLDLDARNKTRQRVTLDNGETAAIRLERGTALTAEDVLTNATGDFRVIVRAADEKLSVVTCRDRLLLNRVCYHLGNRHVPLAVEADRVAYRHDHVLDAMVAGLGAEPVVEQAPFSPEPGAYEHGQPQPHTHGHTHAHG